MFQKCVTSAKWMSYVFPLDIPKLATDILLMLTKKNPKQWLLELCLSVETTESAEV